MKLYKIKKSDIDKKGKVLYASTVSYTHLTLPTSEQV